MIDLSQSFHRALHEGGEKPMVIFCLINAFGARVYSDRHPDRSHLGLAGSPQKADGAFFADGACRAGEGYLNVVDSGALVLGFGRLRETLTPLSGEMMASLSQREASTMSISLANPEPRVPGRFSRLEGVENLLGAEGEIKIGFTGLKQREYITRFKGEVISYRLEHTRLTLFLKA